MKTARSLDLDACRPQPVGAEERAAALQLLPTEGEVTNLSQEELTKLQAISVVLQAHRRVNVYGVKVISAPQAWTGLHKRAVLLISLNALDLLSCQELQGLVAHEIGHEYVWEQYASARARNDEAALRELELICDVIAARTLRRLDISQERLESAIEKLFVYNRERLGEARDASRYPSVRQRERVIEESGLK